MPDRDDTYARHWLSYRDGVFAVMDRCKAWVSDLQDNRKIGYRKLDRSNFHLLTPEALIALAATAEGRAKLQDCIDRFAAYHHPSSPFTAQPSRRSREVVDSTDCTTKLFQDMKDGDCRCEGEPNDPLCGAQMRLRQKAYVATFLDNLTRFYDGRMARRRSFARLHLVPPILSLASLMGFYALASQKDPIVPLVCNGVAGLTLLGAGLWIRNSEKHDNKDSQRDFIEACAHNAREMEADLAAQTAYYQMLIREVQNAAEKCSDEALVKGRLEEGPDDKAFMIRLADWLEKVLEGLHARQAECNYLIVMLTRAIEDKALYRAFYFDGGPEGWRISKTSWPYSCLAALAITACGWTAAKWISGLWSATTLAVCLTVLVAGWLLLFDLNSRMRQRLDPSIVSDMPENDPDPDPDSTGPGGPRGRGPRASYEDKLHSVERGAALKKLAREERRRRRA